MDRKSKKKTNGTKRNRRRTRMKKKTSKKETGRIGNGVGDVAFTRDGAPSSTTLSVVEWATIKPPWPKKNGPKRQKKKEKRDSWLISVRQNGDGCHSVRLGFFFSTEFLPFVNCVSTGFLFEMTVFFVSIGLSLGFTRFYWSLLEFTGFYRVLLGFT